MKDAQQQRRMRQLDDRGRPQVERFGQNNDDVEMAAEGASGGPSGSGARPQVKHCLG